jgi:hypothetical protein
MTKIMPVGFFLYQPEVQTTMSRFHIPTHPAPAPFNYPAAFRFTENGDYVKYGHQVFEGRQAALRSLAAEDDRFLPHADRYWGARGGSHTDGGAFIFTVSQENEVQGDASCRLTCADKFGQPVTSAARLLVSAYQLGWQRFIVYNWRGGRFAVCGLGPDTTGVRVDIYGDAGDYLGSGLDGAEVHVHGDAQDQVGQILKSGSLVIHGDVGQTFLYGAKGGEIYVMGSTVVNSLPSPTLIGRSFSPTWPETSGSLVSAWTGS